MSETRVAIITGAGRGIGRATALELSLSGFTCVLIARSADELNATASLLRGRSLAIPCDVRDATQINTVVTQTLGKFGRLDALINNAGYAPLLPFEQTTPEVWADVMSINVTAIYHFTRAVWDAMAKQKAGVIVNVSSEASRDPYPGFSAYAASKAAVNMLTRVLAKEGDAHGIRVHAIAPAGVETGMLRAIASEDFLPRDQTLDPAHVAAAIRSCVVGDMAFTTGETIFVHRRAV